MSDESAAGTAGEAPESAGKQPGGHRVLTLAGLGLFGLVLLGLAWVVVTGLLARSHLNEARGEIGALREAVTSGDLARADRLVREIGDNADSAHSLTSGPAWWVAANIPVAGTPLRTGRTLALQASRLGNDVLPAIVKLGRAAPEGAARGLGGIDLRAVQRLAPELDRAVATADDASDAVAASQDSWLPLVADGRRSVLHELQRLSGELDGADRAVSILPTMLGADAPQRYFVGFLNEAEARGGGGIPGAFAIVTADRGRISFERFGTDTDLTKVRAKVQLGRELEALYGDDDPTGVLPNSNLSPDFSVAARIWAGMWQAKTGERIDGALAVDPTALGYLLDVTGPARLPDGSPVSGGDIVGITQKRQYALFTGTSARETAERKAYLISIAKAVSSRLLSSTASPAKLIRALSRAAGERRLTVWSADTRIERQLQDARWAGAIGNDVPAPYSGFVVNNAAGSKLDYYLRRTMTYRRTDCAAGGRATASFALTNTAPRSGLPPYVTIRADDAAAGTRPGDNRLLVTYYADRSADITSMTVDGAKVPLVVLPEGTTNTATTTVELPVGRTVTVSVTVSEPKARGPVTVLRQPGVTPLRVDLDGDRCR